jgi:hypothetical protein
VKTRLIRTGVLARLEDADAEEIAVGLTFFAETEDGRQISSETPRHGGIILHLYRRGPNALYPYHREPEPDRLEDYRIRTSDVTATVMEKTGLLGWAGYRSHWVSLWAFLFNGGLGNARYERRGRWRMLQLALRDHGLRASARSLDRLPFALEFDPELRSLLDG